MKDDDLFRGEEFVFPPNENGWPAGITVLRRFDPERTFVTSDHHFGSFALPGPFRVMSAEEEDECIAKWNVVVGKDDVVFYVGDFHDCGLAELMAYRKRLNGEIILIKGNHDKLPDNVYEAVFGTCVEEVTLDDFGLILRHSPDSDETGRRQIFGHLHRNGETAPLVSRRSFCSCVTRNGGCPVSLKDVIAAMDASENPEPIFVG